MSQQSTVSAFRAEAPKGDPCYGPKSKPTLRGPGLQIPLKDAAPSKRQPQSTSEDDESPSGRAESGTPNGGRPWISNQSTNIKTSGFSSASNPSSPASMPQSSCSSIAPSRHTPFKLTSDAFKALFRRSHSNALDQTNSPIHSSSPNAAFDHKSRTVQLNSAAPSLVTTHLSSTDSTAPNSPTTPNTKFPHLSRTTPSSDGLGKPRRSATGLASGTTVAFDAPSHNEDAVTRVRSSSLGNQDPGSWPSFSIPASSGTGLKAYNISTAIPGNFAVDICNLHDEYASSSMIPGKRGKDIGKGATATIKIMYKKGAPRGVQYAVKEFRKRNQSEAEEDYERKVKSEFTIAKSLDHPNIVRTMSLCTHGGRWNHVMEYCSYGEIFSLVKKNYFEQKDKMCLFKQLLQGVAYLHRNGIAHRDIKLENLLLSEEGHLKITDFGVSEVFSGVHPGLRSANGKYEKDLGEIRKCAPGICGSLPYIAPEVLAKSGEYDPRALDVWSCAIVFLALLFRGTPWAAADTKDSNYARFMRGWDRFFTAKPDGMVTDVEYPSCGAAFNAVPKPALCRLLLKMLHPDPARRISVETAVGERSVRVIECCCPDPNALNATGKGNAKSSRKVLTTAHNHLPPEKKGLFQRL